MIFSEASLSGVYIIEQDIAEDKRGSFVKNFRKSVFAARGLESDFVESYYTRSRRDVIRGMHFQRPPQDHAKLVTVIVGTILDVLLDLRKSSPTYLKTCTVELSRENRKSVYVPRGIAHGFGVLSETALAFYMVTSEYSPQHDTGVRYNSFNFEWPISNPIVSDRDMNLPLLPELIAGNKQFI